MMEEKEQEEKPGEINTLGPEEHLESGPDESEAGLTEEERSSLTAKGWRKRKKRWRVMKLR